MLRLKWWLTMAIANTFTPDDCCSGPLSADLFDGHLNDATIWTCPKCGCDWKATIFEGVKHWEARPIVSIIR